MPIASGGAVAALVRFLAVLLSTLVAFGSPAQAQDKAAAAPSPPELSQPLSPEAVREMVSRLSDEDVRKLLIEQLDKGAPGKAEPATKGAAMGMLGTMVDTGQWRRGAREVGEALLHLPQVARVVALKLAPTDGALAPLLVAVALALIAGALCEFAWNRAMRSWRASHSDVRGESFFADALRRGIGLLVDFTGLLAFWVAAVAVIMLMLPGTDLHRSLALELLFALLAVRTAMLVARLILAPSQPALRLLPLPDDAARVLWGFIGFIVALAAFGTVLAEVVKRSAETPASFKAIVLVISTIGLLVALIVVWRLREPVATLIRNAGNGGTLTRLLADIWPVATTAYLLVVYFGRVHDIVSGAELVPGKGIMSLMILIALPIIDYAACRALAALAAAPPPTTGPRAGRRSLIADYEPVLRRVIHIEVVVVGLVWFARLWDINLFAIAQQSLGGRVASSLLGILLVLLLAYMAWEVARTAIDRRLAAELAAPADHSTPASRLRTLLPLLRTTLLITIAVMTVMSVLAALGVEILPLLAGASVIGVAIGFGSQTLVRDIVTGAFFLMDDAFRLGEYIEVGDAKGTVEKITVRSLFLRHHRGALNILPYGEIKRLRNTSRDWIVLLLEFRLALDTDLMKVKKLVRQVAAEIAADEEMGPALLSPLKSQGVMGTDEHALLVRFKYTARPGDQAWLIRRAAYEKILKAFRENDIHFASRTVAVSSAGLSDEGLRQAAAAAIAAAPPPPKPAS